MQALMLIQLLAFQVRSLVDVGAVFDGSLTLESASDSGVGIDVVSLSGESGRADAYAGLDLVCLATALPHVPDFNVGADFNGFLSLESLANINTGIDVYSLSSESVNINISAGLDVAAVSNESGRADLTAGINVNYIASVIVDVPDVDIGSVFDGLLSLESVASIDTGINIASLSSESVRSEVGAGINVDILFDESGRSLFYAGIGVDVISSAAPEESVADLGADFNGNINEISGGNNSIGAYSYGQASDTVIISRKGSGIKGVYAGISCSSAVSFAVN